MSKNDKSWSLHEIKASLIHIETAFRMTTKVVGAKQAKLQIIFFQGLVFYTFVKMCFNAVTKRADVCVFLYKFTSTDTCIYSLTPLKCLHAKNRFQLRNNIKFYY